MQTTEVPTGRKMVPGAYAVAAAAAAAVGGGYLGCAPGADDCLPDGAGSVAEVARGVVIHV